MTLYKKKKMEAVTKLTKCKEEVFELLNALSKQIINIESCLEEKCEIKDLPTDIRLAFDITKSGINILHSSTELLFQKVKIGRFKK